MAVQPPLGNTSPPAQAGGAPPAPANNRPNSVGRRGWSFPRWSILALLLLNIGAIGSYLINIYYIGRPCPMALLCQNTPLVDIVEMMAVWLVFGVLWLVCLVIGTLFLEINTHPGPLARWFRQVSNFTPIRPLLIGAGVMVLILIAVNMLKGRLSLTSLALGALVVLVALQALLWTPHPRFRNQTARGQRRQIARRAGSPWYILRNLRPFTYLFPNRVQPIAPVQPGAQNPPIAPTQPVAPAQPPTPPPGPPPAGP